MSKKERYYRLDKILKEKALYNVIIGERSNGKSYAVQEHGIEEYYKTGKQMALIRRYELDFQGKRGQETFAGLVSSHNGQRISELTNGQWTGIKYYASKWYLCKQDEGFGKIITDDRPFCYAFALTQQEHDKSTNYPNVTNILFDEFLSRSGYLPDEFITFQNVLSTIIRDRDDVTIFMCANTVNKYAPYFKEMGLYHIDKMQQGTIDVYRYGEKSELTVAVEYCGNPDQRDTKKASDKYFAFDNPKLNMIRTGAWEISIYPHLPIKYEKRNIKLMYFIVFNNAILQCEIVKCNGYTFTYVHRKTSELKLLKKDIVFGENYSPSFRIRRNLLKPFDDTGKLILYFYKTEKVFFQDNEIGEIMRNYLHWCNSDRGILN